MHSRIAAVPIVVALLGFLVCGIAAGADAPADPNAPVSFHKQIRPILQANCMGCHQPAKAKGKYVMTAFDRLLAGGDSGDAAIVPGKPDDSALLKMIRPAADGKIEMPKNADPLTEADRNLIAKWIKEGAVDDTPANAKAKFDMDHPPIYSRQPVVTSMDYSPDGQMLAVAAFHEVLLLKPDGSERLARLVGLSQRITSVRFSPDGSKLAVAGGLPARMGELQIWDVAERKLLVSAPAGYDTIYGAAWSPDGQSVSVGCPDHSVRAFDAKTGKQIFFNGAHDDWALDTVFSVDGSHLISVGRDMTTKLYQFSEQRFIDNITSITPGALKGGILAVARHPHRDEIVIGGSDGMPKVYRVFRQTNRVIGDDANVIRELPEMRGRVNTVAVSRDGSLIAAGSSLDGAGQVFVYAYNFTGTLPDNIKAIMAKRVADRKPEEKKAVEDYKHEGVRTVAQVEVGDSAIYAVAFSPDGKTLAAAGGDGMIRLIDPTGGTIRGKFAPAPVDAASVATHSQGEKHYDFILDVNPILSRAGCNQGTCHGAAKGKNGFKLSLRGYDALFDVRALTDDHAARRINLASPDDSLMLLKATGAVPHEGGQRFKPDDPYYKVIRDWIADGAKLHLDVPRVRQIALTPINPTVDKAGDAQAMKVVATYSDGSTREVTHEAFIDSGNTDVAKTDRDGVATAIRRGEAPLLARYEGAYAATTLTVMGDRNGFVWKEPQTWGKIDELVAAKWQRMKIEPSDLCSDAEFIRRVTLDLTGLPPSAEDVDAFLADGRDMRLKRDELIDKLIGSDAFIEHWTNKWADLLQDNGKFLGREGAAALRQWIRKEVADNTPYDQFVRKILTADGSNKDNPAVSYYKILREPDAIMENTTHLFLAVRFNCNKCHDHPFERWTQDQYYETAAYFARVDLEKDPAGGDRKIGGTAVEGAKPLYEKIIDKSSGEITHARTGAVAAPLFPYPAKHETNDKMTRRQELAAWLTSADNRYFALSYVNRLWGYMFGVGIIEPIDDIRASNPPTNPSLLDYLTHRFIDSGFNMRAMLAEICKSRTYQLSFRSNKWNDDDTINYSHARPRRLEAEVLYDTVHAVTGSKPNIPGVPAGTRAAALPDVELGLPDGFLNTFGRPARESACECERTSGLQLGPVMALVSGPTVADAIADSNNAIAKLVAAEPDDRKLVNDLFMRILNRPATDAEVAATLGEIGGISADHAKIAAELDALEKKFAPDIARREDERAKQIAAAKAALEEYQKSESDRIAKWESGQGATKWQIIEPESAKAEKGTVLSVEGDKAIFASGPNQKDVYDVIAATGLKGITGVRLEMLTDDRLPSKGPGRAPGNGNFVLTEFEVFAAPGSPADAADKFKKVKLENAQADFSQDGYDIKTAIDGNAKAMANNGWATHPKTGENRTATFELKDPLDAAKLKFRLIQNYQGNDHQVGKFRLSVTTDAKPFHAGPPEKIAPILAIEAGKRTPEQVKQLVDFYRGQDEPYKKLTAAVGKAQEPIKLDPSLLAARSDFKYSKEQADHQRLTVAQDLAWALINSPAFLFNH
ncbi:MAG: DUF1549 domain-containing protein [Planctomycetes bacterium]|nr:DUF1549 domain-containing protein [Planctomycetota bacterium]